ncbi:MAG: transcription-repair coupling factor [Thermodesulfobacteriota bacterium]
MPSLIDVLDRRTFPLELIGASGSAATFQIARAAATLTRPVVCLCASEREAQALEQDLALFSSLPVAHYPGYEIPPYAPLSPDPATIAARLAALNQALTATTPFCFVASAEAMIRRTIPRNLLNSLAELVIRGEEIDQEGLRASLLVAGYEAVALVQNVGEMSIRGGIMDIFPPGFDHPLRLDFLGDLLESLRLFDPITQRSMGELAEAVILPASDILFPATGGDRHEALLDRFDAATAAYGWDEEEAAVIREKLVLGRDFPGSEFLLPLFYDAPALPLDFLPAEALIFLLNPIAIRQSLELVWERIHANYHEAMAGRKPALPPDHLFLATSDLLDAVARRRLIRCHALAADEETPNTVTIRTGNHLLLKQQLELHRRQQGLLPPLAREIAGWLDQGDQVFFSCRTARHAEQMAELLGQYGLATTIASAPFRHGQKPAAGVVLLDHPLTSGFDLAEEKIHWLSESELFGEQRLGAKKQTRHPAGEAVVRFDELNLGDFIVHRDHGIGIYRGLSTLELNNIPNDFLLIEYKEGDKLYVPVDQLAAVSKYKGINDREPSLDKLGGKAWQTTRQKVKKAVWEVAQDLLNLYARRQLAKGYAFSQPDELFHELEESFPFDETPGQLKAINEVLDDLTSERPMDRLVCGDVGYGKTEVAVRAAFKAIEDNRQVAVLVPTTVLAEQHTATFRERLQGFPVRVESLNRFRSQAEQKKIVSAIAAGQVDIIIGTHRLLSKDVVFQKLGLLIIDEEHRFGVVHKEKLKKLRTQVDVLTLTATPIPRTLQLSLLGVRDLSVISSPPAHRRTVKTFIARHDDLVIKEAVTRELARGGQVFLVHNRVHSIHDIARKVNQLVPEAKVAVAHGQMASKPLEEIMIRFVRQEVNVLVCTTIIESGLDIPNANTIIITRADRLGLAEIYQLRGRVGRSSEQAYAYLLVPSLDGLSKDAQQRLRALMDYNDLGGGFKLAMSDLQIRGGGNILGESQSGTIAAVGYDLYLDLLQKTVLDLKRRAQLGEEVAAEEEVEPEITLRLSAYIPASYIGDTDQRYIAYRKLTSAESEEALLDLTAELEDRYGPIPEETRNLLAILDLKRSLRQLKIAKFEQGPKALVFTFHAKTPVRPERILALVASQPERLRFTPDQKLLVPADGLDSAATLCAAAKKILQALTEGAI